MVVELQLPPVQSMTKYDGKNKLIFNEMVMVSTCTRSIRAVASLLKKTVRG